MSGLTVTDDTTVSSSDHSSSTTQNDNMSKMMAEMLDDIEGLLMGSGNRAGGSSTEKSKAVSNTETSAGGTSS